jgi:hypothetical protein
MIRAAITEALGLAHRPLSGRECAALAGLPYKVAIDALGRMLDAGTVVRFGRKYSALWALAGTPAGLPPDALGALEAVWRGADPHPHGGERAGHPGLAM